MAKLNAEERKHIPSSKFGLPGERKYPMPDKEHARVAKSYASKEEHAGKLSEVSKEKIDRKADSVLGHHAEAHRAMQEKLHAHMEHHKVKNPESHHLKMKHE